MEERTEQAGAAEQDAPQTDDARPQDDGTQWPNDAINAEDRQVDADAENAEILATIEAVLFAADSPLTKAKISSAAELPGSVISQAIHELNERYDTWHMAFRIEQVAGGYQMLTRAEYNDVLSRLLRAKSDSRLSQAAMEALAIVAYRQPIIRADVEAIRGVACGEVLRGLMEKNLVKIVGRAEVLGRPMLYGTTRRFLEVFGLGSLRDLPRVDELKGGAPKEPADPQEESAEEGEQDDGAKERANAAEPSPADDAGPEQAAPEGQYEPATPNSADSVMHEPDEAEFDDDDEDLDEDDELETA